MGTTSPTCCIFFVVAIVAAENTDEDDDIMLPHPTREDRIDSMKQHIGSSSRTSRVNIRTLISQADQVSRSPWEEQVAYRKLQIPNQLFFSALKTRF